MSNQTGQLEIHRLSPSGDVRRRIRCLAGRITVFRANSPELLNAYRRALRGEEVPEERFSLLFDGASFRPADHLFIGFGEVFDIKDTRSTKDLLIEQGISADSIEPLLLSHGLGGRGDVRLGLLSPSEARMTRLLVAVHSKHRVIIVDDPFSGIPDRWINGYARDLADFAWTHSAIIIVSALTQRPDEWIENEVVARIQLEAPRKKTIGFGGESGETEATIEAIREQFRAQSVSIELPKVAAQTASQPASPSPSKISLFIERAHEQLSTTRLLVAGAIGSGILLGYGIVALSSKPAQPKDQLATAKPPAVIVTAAPEPQPTPRSALSGYPADTQEAILQAFNSDDASLAREHLKAAPPLAVPVFPTPAPRRLDTGSSDYQQPAVSVDAPSDDEIQRRREEIRRRFLEAIQQQNQG